MGTLLVLKGLGTCIIQVDVCWGLSVPSSQLGAVPAGAPTPTPLLGGGRRKKGAVSG